MKDEEYELLPHHEIVRLREEVDRLKANPVSSEAANMVSSMNKLNESIQRLIKIFEVAEKELSQEYKHSKTEDKLGRIVYQNKEIAKGIIAVADLIKKRAGPVIAPPTPTVANSSPVSSIPESPPSLEPEPLEDPMSIEQPMMTPEEVPLPPPTEMLNSSNPAPALLPEKKKGWFS